MDLLEKEPIKIFIKKLLDENSCFYNMSVIFVDNKKFNEEYFFKFVSWIDKSIKKGTVFGISYDTNLTQKDIDRFLNSLADYLEMDMIKKQKSFLDDEDKKIAKKGIKNLIQKSK
jgi:hypothetical protein